MRLTTAFTGVIVANIMMTFLSVTATRSGRRTNANLDLAMDPTLWDMTPSPPSAEDVECYVEVRRIERVGGRCISLGARGIPACQAGPNLEPFNDECQGRNGGGRSRPRGRGARRNLRRQRNGRSAFNRRNQPSS